MIPETLNLYDNEFIRWRHGDNDYVLHMMYDSYPRNPREDDQIGLMACFHPRYDLGDQIDEKDADKFWQHLVRANCSYEDIFSYAYAGKLPGIRVVEANGVEEAGWYDVYEMYYMNTVLGNTEPKECLEYACISKEAVADYIIDDLTIRHCMILLEDDIVCLPLWLYDHSGITMSCGARRYPYSDPWDSSAVGWIIVTKEKMFKEGFSEEEWQKRADLILRNEVKEYDDYLTGDIYGYQLLTRRWWNDSEDDNWEELDTCFGFHGNDIMKNGIFDQIPGDIGFAESLDKNYYKTGKAVEHTKTYYTFEE